MSKIVKVVEYNVEFNGEWAQEVYIDGLFVGILTSSVGQHGTSTGMFANVTDSCPIESVIEELYGEFIPYNTVNMGVKED